MNSICRISRSLSLSNKTDFLIQYTIPKRNLVAFVNSSKYNKTKSINDSDKVLTQGHNELLKHQQLFNFLGNSKCNISI